MHLLVTGGSGFIGRALANRLAREAHEVRVLDDLSAGDKTGLDPAVLFTHGDVSDVPKLWTLLQEVDCVLHLAARVSVPQSTLYPSQYSAVNVGGTVSVMEAVRDAGVRRVVFASSGAVYGEQSVQPVHERLPPAPQSPYAVSKLAAELFVHAIGEQCGIETICLRIFNAYGPQQQLPACHWAVVPRFLSQTLVGGSVVVHGDGRQTRDYVFLDDIVDALMAAVTAENLSRLTMNIGSGVETSVNELVRAVERAAGRRAHVLQDAPQPGGVSRLCADISLARKRLNYRPSVTLGDGLRLTIERDSRFSRLADRSDSIQSACLSGTSPRRRRLLPPIGRFLVATRRRRL
ncbi:MAG: NAD-dependent epimerase/dehydratase family protein [Chloroflexi bacterium]|nr:NAD-dependent epimerase/dehydratase family protein [Chloroflexota bacterium]